MKYIADNRLPVPKLDQSDKQAIKAGLEYLNTRKTVWGRRRIQAGLDAIAIAHKLITPEDLPH